MTPLVAVALCGWLLVLIGGAAYAARAVVQDRRAGREWRADARRADRP